MNDEPPDCRVKTKAIRQVGDAHGFGSDPRLAQSAGEVAHLVDDFASISREQFVTVLEEALEVQSRRAHAARCVQPGRLYRFEAAG